YNRFLFRLVKVRLKVYGIFIDIRSQFHGNFTESCLCITHGCRAVPVHGSEVSMAFYKRITCGPVLCHINQGSIDGTVTVRMIFTHRITDDTRTFTVRLVRTVVQLDHRIQDSSLYRLQTVPYIRKRTGSDNAHGIVDIRLFHFFLKIDFLDLIKDSIFHCLSPFPYTSRFFTYFAFSSMNSRLGSTLSPIRVVNVRSSSEDVSSSIVTRIRILCSGSIVVSQS